MGEIEYLRFRWRLPGLEREEGRLDKGFDEKISAAKKRGAPSEKIEELGMEAGHIYFHF